MDDLLHLRDSRGPLHLGEGLLVHVLLVIVLALLIILALVIHTPAPHGVASRYLQMLTSGLLCDLFPYPLSHRLPPGALGALLAAEHVSLHCVEIVLPVLGQSPDQVIRQLETISSRSIRFLLD